MSYFLGMEILGGIVDGKHKFCVMLDPGPSYDTAEEADAAKYDGTYVPFDTMDQAKEYIKQVSGRVVGVKDEG
jgi:hypothetical protein